MVLSRIMNNTRIDRGFNMKVPFDVKEALSQCKTLEDISGKNGLLKRILKD